MAVLLYIHQLFNVDQCQAYNHTLRRKNPHSIAFSGRACRRSSKATRGEDLQIETPVGCRYSPAFDFHPTLAGMLSPTLIWNKVLQVREPREKRLWAATGMMEPLHGE